MSSPSTPPTPPAPEAGQNPLLQRLQTDAVGAQGGGQAGPGEPNGAPSPIPETIEIDFGGAKRRVAVKDLQEAYARNGELTQREKALQEQLKQAGLNEQFRAFGEQLQQLPPQRQAQILELLNGSSSDDGDGGDPTADDLMRAALGDTGSQGDDGARGAPDVFQTPQWKQMMQVVGTLAQRHVDSLQQQRQQTAGERVDALINDFPALRADKVAASFARDHILSQYAASNGQFDLDQAVTEAARRVQELRQPAAQPGGEGVRRPAMPNGFKPTATALQDGSLKRAALERLRSLQGS